MRLQRQTRKGDWNTVLQASSLARIGRLDDYGIFVDAVGSDRITGRELIYRMRLTTDEVARLAKVAGVAPGGEDGRSRNDRPATEPHPANRPAP